MDASQRELLQKNGFDVDGTMRRFLNNEALYLKCLKKFLDDSSYEELKEAYAEGNCNEAFKSAHTMKGFVSNLGIDDLYHLLIPLVEKLRVQDMNIDSEMKQLEIIYQKTYNLIEAL
ncbi:MAG: Hpt domain-containing protein [Lachnospiraceae bacterium]|nr:Hpt domain-containing protein [Lachnospiraceae bacterium]